MFLYRLGILGIFGPSILSAGEITRDEVVADVLHITQHVIAI